MITRTTLTGLFVLCGSLPVTAQPGPRGPAPSDAVSAGIAFVNFGPDDPDTPAWFEITGIAPVISYTRPGLSMSLLRAIDTGTVEGTQSRLEMVDATFLVHSDLRIFGRPHRSGIEPLVPISIATTWRRVERTIGPVTSALFEYQTLGFGTGIGARAVRTRWIGEARVTPSIALATSSFGGTVGFEWGVDAGFWVNTGPLIGPVGLSIGYGFSWRRWRVGGTAAVAVAGNGRFNYTGREHALRLGVSW